MGNDSAFLSLAVPLRLDLVAKKDMIHGLELPGGLMVKANPSIPSLNLMVAT